MSSQDLAGALADYFKDQEYSKLQTVQSLWSGYGEIARYGAVGTSSVSGLASLQKSNAGHKTCIAKVVDLGQKTQHPKGWNTDVSHQRKLSSYLNEKAFYQHFAAFTNERCKVPQLIAASSSQEITWLLMQDLDGAGFSLRSINPSNVLIELGICWLANFHACFMQDTHCHAESQPWENNKQAWLAHKKKVFKIGTYWHLGTRLQEWQSMPETDLKRTAKQIDERLNQARFQTLLHGDAKIANFCIHSSKDKIAAVDFQYVGFGCPVKDLVYFLGSCAGEVDLQTNTRRWLDLYLSELIQALKLKMGDKSTVLLGELAAESRALYSLAWADFERFLMGWSPQHKKLNAYSAQQARIALSQLDNLDSKADS
jgi:aminoglycoside phosphotransferase